MLPATINEAKAAQHVADWLAWARSNKVDILGVSIGFVSEGDGRRFAKEQMKRFGAAHVDNRLAMMTAAMEGDGLAQDALMELWREMESRGERCELLTKHAAQTSVAPPRRKTGDSQQAHLFRDIAIVALVEALCKPPFSLKATRGAAVRAKGGPASACSIVAGQFGLGEDSVDKIWKRLKTHL
ncbi:hypothetical protein [Bradyrhizobium sp. CIR3A]|uniref:hypothetical protein n=1 Tax=Bradyrhizobium sp. CIR3A TaxID=2663838 RepID=UPI0016067ACB|nr:hypothetical protein [Bradyrhizobium sp. CIR3A]MBB4262674.1 hypothetical protein [Bradyrhizobium sp. CIR3A]